MSFAELGTTATDAAAHGLLSHLGLSVTASLTAALRGEADYYVWSGDVWSNDLRAPAPGKFWIPALFKATDLPAAAKAVIAKKAKEGKIIDEAGAVELMARWHSGLGASTVSLSPCAYVEIDHLPRAEQESAFAALSAATGLRWRLQVSSGGKSIHSYISFSRALDPTDPLRTEIQKLLIAILCGDTKITDAGRIMRRPGWDGPDRKQPVVHLDTGLDSIYDPEDVCDRLVSYARTLGINDVDRACDTLWLAEQLAVEAGRQFGEAALELAEHAALLRHTRANPSDEDLDLALVMLGRAPRVTGTTGTSGIARTDRGGKVAYATASDMAAFANVPKFTRVAAPCCPGDKSPAGVVMSEPGDAGPRVWCHRHGQTVVAEVERVVTVISVEDPCDSSDAEGSDTSNSTPSPPDGRWWQPPIPAEAGVYLLNGPTGCGKSTAIRAASEAVSSTLAIGPTIRLVDNQSGDLDIPSYGDLDGDIYDPSAAVCLPSLGRWRGGVPELLVIDEVETIFSMLHSQQIMGRRGRTRPHGLTGPVYSQLASLIRATVQRGGRVVCADANLSKRTVAVLKLILAPTDDDQGKSKTENTIDYIMELFGHEADNPTPKEADPMPIKVIGPGKHQRRMHSPLVTEYRYEAAEDLLLALEASVESGQRAMVACDTRAGAQLVEALVSTWRLPSGEVPTAICITAEETTPKGFFNDKCASFDGYDVVIYNTACGQGVSYEGAEHRTVWLLASGWLGWDALVQLRGRCRPATDVHSFVPARHPKVPLPPATHFMRLALIQRATDDRLAGKSITKDDADDKHGETTVSAVDVAVRHAWGWEQWLQRARRRMLGQDYYSAVADMGVNVVDADPLDDDVREMVREVMADLRTAIAEGRVEAVEQAASVVGEELEALRTARDARTRAEHWSLGRMLCLDRWGIGGVEFGSDDWANRDSRMWKQGRLLRAALAVVVGGDALGSLRVAERARATVDGEGRYTSHYRGDERKARTMLKVLADLGVDLKPTLRWMAETAEDRLDLGSGDAVFALNTSSSPKAPSPPTWSKDTLTPHAASRWLTKGNKALLADVPGKKHLSDTPTRLLGACLRALGLKTRRTTLGSVKDGSRADGYVLDMDKAEAWAKANSRAWRQHLGHGVVDLGICALIVDHRQGRDIWEGEDEINMEVLLGDDGFVESDQETERTTEYRIHKETDPPGGEERSTPLQLADQEQHRPDLRDERHYPVRSATGGVWRFPDRLGSICRPSG